MVMKDLKYRMYGLVPYNISEIQKGIQFGHAVVEYQLQHGDSEEYKKWASEDKTFIILNGGTTNLSVEKPGSLNEYLQQFKTDIGIKIATFYEPDLGDQLTAFVFLVDERVFDKKKYPDFDQWYVLNHKTMTDGSHYYNTWLEFIGGEVNYYLREVLSNLRLA